MSDSFWERPEIVEQFAARAPDHRLIPLLERYERPAEVRVLDLGCAGGRNSVLLAERGFDVWALDSSPMMVEHTRERVASILGVTAVMERIQVGRMDDLTAFSDGTFALVVALGVFHNAQNWLEWERAISETARVLASGGLLLANQFTPEVDLTGEGVRAIGGECHVYEGLSDGRGVLLDAADLDAAMARLGLHATVPSQTVRVETERGRRVSVNALYAKAKLAGATGFLRARRAGD